MRRWLRDHEYDLISVEEDISGIPWERGTGRRMEGFEHSRRLSFVCETSALRSGASAVRAISDPACNLPTSSPPPTSAGGSTHCEMICKAWTSRPERLSVNPPRKMPGANVWPTLSGRHRHRISITIDGTASHAIAYFKRYNVWSARRTNASSWRMRRRNPKHAKRLLARNLRRHRQERAWSQDDLAAEAGVRQALISAVEVATANPTLETLDKIAVALGIEVADLLAGPNARARWPIRLRRKSTRSTRGGPARRRSLRPSP
ncbi:helix-turn-helix transcriptional regulator [Mesorhizobium sp.]|uniref:helix-turn-helix domain-containing protein n=1 Tax=Mesorhizobium sp. TaxID=1871066 RepID=UPI00345A8926